MKQKTDNVIKKKSRLLLDIITYSYSFFKFLYYYSDLSSNAITSLPDTVFANLRQLGFL